MSGVPYSRISGGSIYSFASAGTQTVPKSVDYSGSILRASGFPRPLQFHNFNTIYFSTLLGDQAEWVQAYYKIRRATGEYIISWAGRDYFKSNTFPDDPKEVDEWLDMSSATVAGEIDSTGVEITPEQPGTAPIAGVRGAEYGKSYSERLGLGIAEDRNKINVVDPTSGSLGSAASPYIAHDSADLYFMLGSKFWSNGNYVFHFFKYRTFPAPTFELQVRLYSGWVDSGDLVASFDEDYWNPDNVIYSLPINGTINDAEYYSQLSGGVELIDTQSAGLPLPYVEWGESEIYGEFSEPSIRGSVFVELSRQRRKWDLTSGT